MTPKEFNNIIDKLPTTPRLPILFVGHGNPMNAIEDNIYSRAWKQLEFQLPKPKAILSISAHWLSSDTSVHISKKPRTIHDFWGFPDELYKIEYPCPGAPDFAMATQEIVNKTTVLKDVEWGLDHGTWSVLHHMYPNAEIPVYQLSINLTKTTLWHYELAKELAPLREKGVLIMGSGNIVHNLSRLAWEPNATPYDWAEEFDQQSKKLIIEENHRSLIEYEKLGPAAKLAIPTPDHYWPLIYVLGLQKKNESVSFPIEGIALGSVGMRTVLIGESLDSARRNG